MVVNSQSPVFPKYSTFFLPSNHQTTISPYKGDGDTEINHTMTNSLKDNRQPAKGFDKKKALVYSHMLDCAYYRARITMSELLKLLKALSDETRLRIANLVLQRECCVCEVVQAMQISQTRASRNLGILHDAGLLKARREGLWVLYSIDEQAMEKKSCAGLAEIIRTAMQNDELAALDRERLKTAVREGPCSKWVFA